MVSIYNHTTFLFISLHSNSALSHKNKLTFYSFSSPYVAIASKYRINHIRWYRENLFLIGYEYPAIEEDDDYVYDEGDLPYEHSMDLLEINSVDYTLATSSNNTSIIQEIEVKPLSYLYKSNEQVCVPVLSPPEGQQAYYSTHIPSWLVYPLFMPYFILIYLLTSFLIFAINIIYIVLY